MNDQERRLWINNNEVLYRLWKGSGLNMNLFIKKNREVIDKFVLEHNENLKRSIPKIYAKGKK